MNKIEQEVYDALSPIVKKHNITEIHTNISNVAGNGDQKEMELADVRVLTSREPGPYWVRIGSVWKVAQYLGEGKWLTLSLIHI